MKIEDKNNLSSPSNKNLHKANEGNNKVSNKPKNNISTFIYALGGIGEVGKNMYVIEEGNDIWIVDAGIMFSGSEHAGTEGIIQSFEQLRRNHEKIRGLIITHGHEDHIGAIPYLIKSIKIPLIYAPRMAAELIKLKIKDKAPRLKAKIALIDHDSELQSQNLNISFFNVNHSIPDSMGVIFKSKNNNGTVVTTGDFKFDLSPVGSSADFLKMAKLGENGVDLLMSDSTNSLVEGFSISEKDVNNNIQDIFQNINGRIIIASFASNVFRVKSIIESGLKQGRKIVVLGRSMERSVSIATKIRYINVSKGDIIDPREMRNYDSNKILVICTGSQGEELAALNRIAHNKHKEIKLDKSDTIIFSSSPIPGNYLSVESLINRFYKEGVRVIQHNSGAEVGIHASGHGSREEQKLMLNLMKPKFFFPIHGEFNMLMAHAKTAQLCGIDPKKIFILKNGSRLKLSNKVVTLDGNVPSDDVFIDGRDVGGVTNKIMPDRIKLGKHGIISISIGIHSKTNMIISGPHANIKGCFKFSENKNLISEMEQKIKDNLNNYINTSNKTTFYGLKEIIRTLAEEFIFEKTKREPIIIPVILSKKDYPIKIYNENEANNHKG